MPLANSYLPTLSGPHRRSRSRIHADIPNPLASAAARNASRSDSSQRTSSQDDFTASDFFFGRPIFFVVFMEYSVRSKCVLSSKFIVDKPTLCPYNDFHEQAKHNRTGDSHPGLD